MNNKKKIKCTIFSKKNLNNFIRVEKNIEKKNKTSRINRLNKKIYEK